MTGTNSVSACVMPALRGFVGGQLAKAQDVSRYRGYVLESSLDSVLEDSGVRAKDVQTVHEKSPTPASLARRHERSTKPHFTRST